jgi:hypothetical protein
MQRTFYRLCGQLEDCIASGGKAAIFYGESYEGECLLPSGLDLTNWQCSTRAWVPTIGISRAQGTALAGLVFSGKLSNVSRPCC